MSLFLDLIATLLIVALVGHQTFSALVVWGGPYPEKFKYALISGGVITGALLTLLAVWS